MATVNYDYSFTPNTAAKATEVNGNFNKIKQFAEGISTGVNLDAGAVSSTNIVDGAISTAKLANDAVTTSKLLNANVTFDKLVAAVPRGVIARETRTSNTSTGSAINAFNGISFTPVVGRLYKISFSGFAAQNFNDYATTYDIAFVDSSNNILQYINVGGTFGTSVFVNSIADSFIIAPSTTTTITLNVRLFRTGGTDTFYFNGAANKQNYLLVEDIGAA